MNLRDLGMRKIFNGDDEYPRRLAETDGSPEKLWLRGSGSRETDIHIAVVGSRQTSAENLRAGQKLLQNLLQLFVREYSQPFVIVSGLALGTDAMAHTFALREDIPTVGVMGTPINRMYPAENVHLANAIATKQQLGNALLSEHGPIERGEESLHDFLARNRIIAWASWFTIIIGAESERSGTIATARRAHQAGRKIFFLEGTVKPTVAQLLVGEFSAIPVRTAGQIMKQLR